MNNPAYLPMLLLPLMAFGIYRRVRRNLGAQLLRPKNLKFRIGLFGLAALMLLMVCIQEIPLAACVIGGILGGVALGAYSLHLTRFETRADGVYYTPNLFLGLALSALVLARVGYRLIMLWSQANGAQPAPTGPQLSPLTFALIALLVGYYLAYSIGILRHPHANALGTMKSTAENRPPT